MADGTRVATSRSPLRLALARELYQSIGRHVRDGAPPSIDKLQFGARGQTSGAQASVTVSTHSREDSHAHPCQ